MGSAGRVIAAACSALAIAGCGTGSMSFRVDDSVHVTSPAPLITAVAPFQITWTAPSGPDRYGVFVDIAPIAPGATMRSLATQDCKRIAACWPDPSYLAGLGVYVSDPALHGSGAVDVEQLVPLNGIGGSEAHPVHTATLVRLDPSGHTRIDDVAWQVEFRG